MGIEDIAIIGAGAWGTALAAVAARAGLRVTLYARDAAAATRIAQTRESPRLPGIKLDDAGARSPRRGGDLAAHDAILLAVPAQHLREAAIAIAPGTPPGTPIIACAKGIERSNAQIHDRSDRGMRSARGCPRSCPARASRPTSRAACPPR